VKSVAELMDLRGRTALVTGAAGQLGPVVCETLAELGANVIAIDVQAEACEKVAHTLTQRHGVEVSPMAVNLEHFDEVEAACATIHERHQKLDILVNAAALTGTGVAGPGWAGPFAEQSMELFQRACSVNLMAPFLLVQRCSDLLRRSGHGAVINFISIYGVSAPDLRIYGDSALGNPAAYAATKGGLLQVTRWLSTVLAPEVRVNAISPGGILAAQPEQFIQNYSARTPLGRMGVPQDIKGAIVFLATDLSQYVTGQNLLVDGGWTTW
jgi:NAD(P)-dependent dehydrogenase (short-subunit alcohol dehydrogenase family)